MSALAQRILRLLAVLWAGSLWATALWFAPALFRILPDRHAAGAVAATYFRIETYATLVMALALLLASTRNALRWPVYGAAGVLLINDTLVRHIMQAALASGSAMGLSFAAWHAVGGSLYLLACAAACWWWWRAL